MRDWQPEQKRTVAALAAVTIGSVLAIGAVHNRVMVALSLGVLVAVLLAVQARLRQARFFPLPALVLAALALYSALQAMPLPLSWLEVIAPANADIHARSLAPFGQAAPLYASISLDPGASLVEALKWLSYAGVFTAAYQVSVRQGSTWAAAVVFIAAILVSIVTLAHGLAGATKLYGIYAPSFQVAPWHVGPLLNPNNLAGYLNLGAFCGVGLCLSRKLSLPRQIAWTGVALIIATALLSASRGGILLLPVGLLVVGWLSYHRAGSSRHRGRALVALGAAAVCGIALAVVGGSTGGYRELLDTNISKLDIAYDTKALIANHPWLGIGRGAFESVFSAYRLGENNRVFTHAENWPAQWASEWGIVVTSLAFIALLWWLRPVGKGWRRQTGSAVLVGIVILLIQNFVDLGLEIPGVCVALFLLLGALHGDAGSTSESTRRPRWRANRLASAYAICVVALSGLVLLRARNVADERTRLARIEKHIDIKNDAHRAAFRAELKQAMCRFPAEPFFPQLGGAFAFRAADQNPLPWIQRALERGMGNGRTHLLLALVLERRGYRAQARMQLRLALNRSPDLANEAARIALRSTSKLAELMSAVPQGGSGVPMLERLAARAKDPALREAFDKETLARDSTRPAPLFRLGSALVATVAAGGCDASCTKNIDKHVKSLDDAAPDGSLGAQLRARQLSALGQQDKALEMLATRCRQVTDRTACLAERARLAAAARSKHFTPAAKDYLLVACVDIRSCARAHSWIGDRYASLQNWPLALSNYQKAAKFEPKAERWLAVAKTATNAQLHAAAVEAIERVLKDKRFANDKKTRAWLAREHDLLIGATIEK